MTSSLLLRPSMRGERSCLRWKRHKKGGAMKSSTALLSLLFLLQKSWTVVAFQSLAPAPRRLPPRPLSSSFATRIQRPHVAELSVSIHNEVDPVIRKRRLATWMALFTGMADVALSLRKLQSMLLLLLLSFSVVYSLLSLV